MADATPLFYGRIENGRLILDEKDAFTSFVSKWEGKEIALSIKKSASTRTNAENRYYWGVIVNMVAAEVGIIPDDAHELLKGLFLKVGVEHEGKRYEIVRSTSSLSVSEFEDYAEKCRQWSAVELDCPIPLPNEVEF